MSSSIVLGSGKVAEAISRILCSSGARVALVGSNAEAKENIKELIREDVEQTIPFMFADDLKHQEDAIAKHMKNLKTYRDLKSVADEANVIFDATEGNENSLINDARRALPTIPIASIGSMEMADERHVALHIYEPFEVTKIARVIFTPNTSKSALTEIRQVLTKAGIAEITCEQGDVADRMLNMWRAKNSSTSASLSEMISALVPGRAKTEQSYDVMH